MPIQPVPPAHPASATGLFRAVGLAFLGGLLLNLMPCVFPVLFLKGLSLVTPATRSGTSCAPTGWSTPRELWPRSGRLVGVLLGLKAAGSILGWGFQFQSPVFLSLMAGLLFFLGLSLAGQFEIGLSITGAGDSLTRKQGYAGSFFTGVLAVGVATPLHGSFHGHRAWLCAGAERRGYVCGVYGAGAGSGCALRSADTAAGVDAPPAQARGLDGRPQAAGVAVPIFATAIWLAWVLVRGYGADILVALLSSFLLLAIAGWFLGRWPARRWATIVAALILVGAIAVSIVAPRRFASASNSNRGDGRQRRLATLVRRRRRPLPGNGPSCPCRLHRVVVPELPGQRTRPRSTSRPVQKAFQDANVALLKADWTRGDDDITQALASFGRSGVPALRALCSGRGAASASA